MTVSEGNDATTPGTREGLPDAKEIIPAIHPQSDRVNAIRDAVSGRAPGHFVPMPQGLEQVPVGRVAQDMLIYRIDNGRIGAAIEEHLRETGETWAHLRQHAADPSVQRLVHGLLMAAAADPRGPIMQELERQGQQTEPLLVDAEGVVVNGNRRLCALRTLLHRDPERFAGFADVAVAVLPETVTAADVDYIEAALQMAPETKLGYGWIDRRLKLRRQRDELGLPEAWILSAYQIEDAAQLDREIAELELAEAYLEQWLEAPHHYGRIQDAEDLFRGLREQLTELPEELRDIWRLAGFAMIGNRTGIDVSIDREFPFVAPQPPHLPSSALIRLSQEQGILSGDADMSAGLDGASRQALRVVFTDHANAAESARDLLRAISQLREEHRERVKPAAMIKRVRDIRARMDQLDPSRLSPKQQSVLRGEIAAIQAQAAYLLGEHPETRFEQQKTTMVKAVSAYLRRWREIRRNAKAGSQE